ncbi:hypothetical protein P43SY_002241 [Pythium insidiosum]|uniref:PUB domain-containing protein n=1 Tax=Pythium insidiosum TaxID=114742 RepID=A0AAD5QEM7_PYTIN|nr:hypothetical protein P43SY_002241 [Pythium insidiosum]
MSELKAALAGVERLEGELLALQRLVDEQLAGLDTAAVLSLEPRLRALVDSAENEVAPLAEKLRQRSKMTDPVTNEPRFGPKTMERVLDMLRRFDVIKTDLDGAPWVERLHSAIAGSQEQEASQREREMSAQRQLEEQRLMQQRAEDAQRQQKEAEERERQRVAKEEEQRRTAELARLAEEKRAERERQRLAEEARIREEQRQLDQRNAQAIVGVDGLACALSALQHAITDQNVYRQTLQRLLVLVSNICASPENAAFRSIPKDNPHFHNDIGQHDGGHDALLSLGFREMEPEAGKRVFVMEEPNLEEDLDKWSNWFDGLKVMKEFLEEKRKMA